MIDVQQRLASIEAQKGDAECAHSAEDRLYIDFIRYIALIGPTDELCEMAQEVLKAGEIDFPRYCA